MYRSGLPHTPVFSILFLNLFVFYKSLATGAAGLLGVPGTTSAVVDAQRAEQGLQAFSAQVGTCAHVGR